MHRLVYTLRKIFARERAQRELDEEIQHHIEMRIEKNTQAGMKPKLARQAALRDFGNVDRTKENCRDSWGSETIMTIWKDVCFGIRGALFRRPKAFAIITLTLSLCLGWLVSTFSLFEATFYRELPIDEPYRVVHVLSEATRGAFSYLNAVDYIEENQSFESLAAYLHFSELIWDRENELTILNSAFVTPNFFHTLKMNMELGNAFIEGENVSHADTAIISHQLWTGHFNSRQDIIGKTMVLNRKVITIAGVTPPGFAGVRNGRVTNVWIPVSNLNIALPKYFTTNRSHTGFRLIGRLKDNTTASQAELELELIAQNLETTNPNHAYTLPKLIRVSGEKEYQKDSRQELHRLYLLVLAISSTLFVVACCNIFNVLISGIFERQGEFTIRLSLGASPKRLLSLLFWENAVLAAAGGLGGTILLILTLNFAAPLLGFDFITPNYRAFFLMGGLLVVLALLFTGASFIYIQRNDLVTGVKRSITGAPKSIVKKVLLLTQVSLSSSLLIYSLFSTQSLQNAWSLNPGHSTRDVVLARIHLKATGWKINDAWNYYWNLKKHLESLPGVEGVGISGSLPLSGAGSTEISINPSEPDGSGKRYVNQTRIGPDFFDTMGIPLLQGECTDKNDHFRTEYLKDHAGPLPIVVNNAFTDQFFPTEDPINKIVYKGHSRRDLIIKGVVADFKVDLYSPPSPGLYIPYDYYATKNRFLVWHIKTESNRPDTIRSIKEAIVSFNSSVPIIQFETIEDHLRNEFIPLRSASIISSGLAAIGVVLSGLGIWAMLRFEIDGRKREIGIRMALGSETWKLSTLLAKDVIRIIVSGLSIGILTAAVAVHYSKTILFGSDPLNLIPYIQALGLIILTGALSATGPIRNLWRKNPLSYINGEK